MPRYSKKQKRGIKLRKQARKKRERAKLKRLNIPISSVSNLMYQHHYVPRWYQKQFLPPKIHKFYYLDLSPDTITTPNGIKYTRNELLNWGPSRCFKQDNLYTIELFGCKSDIIERQLFGEIDGRGRYSFDIFASPKAWQQTKAHDKFEYFIEFMDAQKLRTPKGMNLIKSLCITQGQEPNKLLVLGLMQQYRKMHCAMWIESIWEVVTAKNSQVKFIINDHPVIAYNPKVRTPMNIYNMTIDPPISLLGTHTIFPLDLEHCLILTHRQYALASDKCDPLDDRINARYGDKAIFGFRKIIFERDLTDEDVCKINFITKESALRYVASPEKEWLYPEKLIQEDNWESLYEVLMPPKEKITLTQSIVIGHKDGSVEGYDPFGRDISTEEKEKFNKTMRQVTLGKEISNIFDNDSKTDLYNKGIVLLDSIKEIFGINKGKTIDDIRKELTGGQIKLLYRVIAELYPYKINFCDLIPPNNNLFRGLFLGHIHPQTIHRDISNIIHLFDEVLIINPFSNPNSLRDKFNPIYNPNEHLRNTYKLILSLLMIEPFIREGLVKIIPDPADFEFSLKMKLMRVAEQRRGNIKFDEDENVYLQEIEQLEFRQITRSLPKEYIREKLKQSSHDISDEDINKVLEYIDLESQGDLTDIAKPLQEMGPQYTITRLGLNLEGTLLFCKLTGATPITYISFKNKEFLSIANNASGCKRWNPLIKLFDANGFFFDRIGDAIFNHFLRSEGFFENFREYLKKIYRTIYEIGFHSNKKDLEILCNEYSDIYQQYLEEWEVAIKTHEEWQSTLPDDIRNDLVKSRDIFQKGDMKLILGDLSTPSIDHLLKIHFPNQKVHKIIPMSIYLDSKLKQEK